MNMDLTKEIADAGASIMESVFMGSGFAAMPRPGMTTGVGKALSMPPFPTLSFPPNPERVAR
jgi:hypothetical protein